MGNTNVKFRVYPEENINTLEIKNWLSNFIPDTQISNLDQTQLKLLHELKSNKIVINDTKHNFKLKLDNLEQSPETLNTPSKYTTPSKSPHENLSIPIANISNYSSETLLNSPESDLKTDFIFSTNFNRF